MPSLRNFCFPGIYNYILHNIITHTHLYSYIFSPLIIAYEVSVIIILLLILKTDGSHIATMACVSLNMAISPIVNSIYFKCVTLCYRKYRFGYELDVYKLGGVCASVFVV